MKMSGAVDPESTEALERFPLDVYELVRRLLDGRLAAVQERMFNSILLVGIKGGTYDEHW